MASEQDRQSFNRMRLDAAPVQVIIERVPQLPDDVRKRFPSLLQWEKDMEAWRIAANRALKGGEQ